MNDGSGKSRFRPRIVMIDDEKSNLQIVKIVIMRENLESDLSLFENGASALEFIQKNPVDLILLDLAMPEMDGFEIMSRLQADPNTADIPVIFLSAYQEASYILKAFDLGATDFIGKPIISPILTARIRQIIKSRSLEKELRLRNTELVDTNRLKDELLSICSHDLRAPLSAIELICQFLEDTIHGRSENSQQELVNRIVSQSRLARRLVENLLDLNRIEQGRLVPASSLFSVDELLEQCVKEEDPNLLSRDLEFELSPVGGGVLCFGDRGMIAQVVHNLFNNAAKYAESKIRCEARLVSHSQAEGGRLRVVVSDDGKGIPAGQSEMIFQKYLKLERQGSGSGLGLYISKQMIDLHGGEISVAENNEQGARFVIELPNAFQPDQLPVLADYSHARILISGESKSWGEMVEGLLLESGLIYIEQARTHGDIHSAFAPTGPNLVIVDLATAGLMEGFSTTLEWGRSGVDWILIGQLHQSEIQRTIPASSRFASLKKPFNPLVFLRQVQNFLQDHGTVEASALVK